MKVFPIEHIDRQQLTIQNSIKSLELRAVKTAAHVAKSVFAD
jgi:hypothetical protein